MRKRLGLAAVLATLFLVSGCSGLHNRNKPTTDPVRLPGAPALDGTSAGAAVPGINNTTPMVPPARSLGTN